MENESKEKDVVDLFEQKAGDVLSNMMSGAAKTIDDIQSARQGEKASPELKKKMYLSALALLVKSFPTKQLVIYANIFCLALFFGVCGIIFNIKLIAQHPTQGIALLCSLIGLMILNKIVITNKKKTL